MFGLARTSERLLLPRIVIRPANSRTCRQTDRQTEPNSQTDGRTARHAYAESNHRRMPSVDAAAAATEITPSLERKSLALIYGPLRRCAFGFLFIYILVLRSHVCCSPRHTHARVIFVVVLVVGSSLRWPRSAGAGGGRRVAADARYTRWRAIDGPGAPLVCHVPAAARSGVCIIPPSQPPEGQTLLIPSFGGSSQPAG